MDLKAPLTAVNVEAWYEAVHAPWVKAQGLCDFETRARVAQYALNAQCVPLRLQFLSRSCGALAM